MVLDGEEPQEVARTVGSLMSLVVAEELVAVGDETVGGPEGFKPMVIVAMIFWGVTAWFSLFVLRLIFRPAG